MNIDKEYFIETSHNVYIKASEKEINNAFSFQKELNEKKKLIDDLRREYREKIKSCPHLVFRDEPCLFYMQRVCLACGTIIELI